MRSQASTQERCHFLLKQWRKDLVLSKREKCQLAGELATLDRQMERFRHRHLRLAVFGRVGVGKSSLLNALLGKKCFATDVAHGSTRKLKALTWDQPIRNLQSVELLDTPGIDEINAKGRARLAARVAIQADLILLVIDSDITLIELEALKTLLSKGKPIFLILNRCDQWSLEEQNALLKSIRNRLPQEARGIDIEPIAAAPRKALLKTNGQVRSEESPPRIKNLQYSLINLLENQGELLLALNALRESEHFNQCLKMNRLQRNKIAAQGLIGRFAAIKASGVAANPLLLFDIAGGLICDATLVLKLCNLYGIKVKGNSARTLVTQLSSQNALLGGAQLTIQVFLGILRQLLIISAPFTGGLSLASAAPVAIAQAALAVHTTKVTGKLAAQEVIRTSQRNSTQPGALLKRLAVSDPQVKSWLYKWPNVGTNESVYLPALLP